MKNNKIVLIGAIHEGKAPCCGETMKNQLFIKRYKELFDKVISTDISHNEMKTFADNGDELDLIEWKK